MFLAATYLNKRGDSMCNGHCECGQGENYDKEEGLFGAQIHKENEKEVQEENKTESE